MCNARAFERNRMEAYLRSLSFITVTQNPNLKLNRPGTHNSILDLVVQPRTDFIHYRYATGDASAGSGRSGSQPSSLDWWNIPLL